MVLSPSFVPRLVGLITREASNRMTGTPLLETSLGPELHRSKYRLFNTLDAYNSFFSTNASLACKELMCYHRNII